MFKFILRRELASNLVKNLQVTNVNRRGLHACMRFTLRCSRVIGLFPLSGLNNPVSQDLKFQLKSPYTIIYVISLLGQILMFILSSCRLIQNGYSLTNVTNSLFYTTGLTSAVILLYIAKCWPRLIHDIEDIEQELPPFKRNVTLRCNLITTIVVVTAIVEHLFSLYFGLAVARLCDERNISDSLFYYYMPWIFDYTSYHIWKGLLAEIFNVQSTLMWSYNDIMLMVISVYLTEHFTYHAQLLKTALQCDHFCGEEFRMQYLKILRILKLINRQFGIYILTSFGSNLFWICMQLFYTLNNNQTGPFITCPKLLAVGGIRRHILQHSVYFIFSLCFVVMRTTMVLLLTARIHLAALKPLPLLYEIPSSRFNVELKRYIDQINNLKVALTGMDFFYVTRNMILSLLGTIVTYELVLLQFNK